MRGKSGWAWYNTRVRVMRRDEWTCQLCGLAGLDRKTGSVDHICSVRDGGSDADSNLRTLCNWCHRARTKRQQQRWAGKHVINLRGLRETMR